jgi:hypothetical protein
MEFVVTVVPVSSFVGDKNVPFILGVKVFED